VVVDVARKRQASQVGGGERQEGGVTVPVTQEPAKLGQGGGTPWPWLGRDGVWEEGGCRGCVWDWAAAGCPEEQDSKQKNRVFGHQSAA
jgi:hypothetical protein